MTPKRTIVVAVAVAVGVAASVLSYVFLNNAQQRAYNNAKLVQAYVVVKPVPATLNGSLAISDGYVQVKKIPQEFRPTTAVTKISSIEGKQAVASLAIRNRTEGVPPEKGHRDNMVNDRQKDGRRAFAFDPAAPHRGSGACAYAAGGLGQATHRP